jgi:hypothetical protein
MGCTTDGQLAIDNHRVENSLRAIALSRKKYLFAGYCEATRHAAVINCSCVKDIAFLYKLFQMETKRLFFL